MNPVNIGGNLFWLNEKHEFHREDGPAIEWVNGNKEWYINGKPHREDGPVLEYSNGFKLWFYHGEKIDCKTNEEFLRIIKLRGFW